MAQSKLLIDTLKKELKSQGKTYRDVARVLDLSEASVKRLFAERTFVLNRLDQICELLGLEISDLAKKAEQATQLTTNLSLQQEQELVSDIKLLLMAHFLINRWSFVEIMESFDISEPEGIQLMARLDRMKLIQLLPGNRVKLILASNFRWISDGPIQRFYEDKVQADFFDSQFDGAGEYRVFLSTMLTNSSNAELIRKLKRLANEFNDMGSDDESFPVDERVGTSMLVAMRPFPVGIFNPLRKKKAKQY